MRGVIAAAVVLLVVTACGTGSPTAAPSSSGLPSALISAPSATPAGPPSVSPPAFAPCTLTIGAAQVAVPRAKLVSLGFFGFPDGIFGVVKDGDRYSFYAAHAHPVAGPHQRAVPPAGPPQSSIARLVGTLDDPAAFGGATSLPITGLKASLDYVGGGPLYRDPATRMLLLFYHAERWPQLLGDQFWASYGIARSMDDGATWVDLGEFYAPEVAFVDAVPAGTAPGARSVPVPAAAYVIVDGYFYVYAKDRAAYDKPNSWLTVARAKVEDVVAAARNGHVSTWTKYFQGAWSEPGLGGRASPLEVGNPSVRNSDVVFSSVTRRFIMVIAGAISADRDGIYLIESVDGVTWGPRRVIDDGPNLKLFPTVVGLGDDPRAVGADFNIYYPRDRQNQADTDLLRRRITCT